MFSLAFFQRRALPIAMLIAFALAGIACSSTGDSSASGGGTGSSTSGGSSTTTSAPAATATPANVMLPSDLCTLASTADIAGIVGKPISIDIHAGGGMQQGVQETVCGYGSSTATPPTVDLFYYLVEQGDPQALYAQLKQMTPNPTDIPNLGDAAFWIHITPKTRSDAPYSVFVRRGTLIFGIGMPGLNDQTTALTQEQKIAMLILSHL